MAAFVSCGGNSPSDPVPNQTPIVATPAAFPPAGGYPSGTKITLTSNTPGAVIHYTIDGSTPNTSSPVYSYPYVVLNSSLTIKAIAVRTGMEPSAVMTASYTINNSGGGWQVDRPTAMPPGGHYDEAQTVSLTSATPGAFIWYTVDGSDPGAEYGEGGDLKPYVAPIPISEPTTLKAIAKKEGMENSEVSVEHYFISSPGTHTVTFDSMGGSAVSPITGVASGATINAPPDPTWEGYTFAGWHRDSDYTTPWNFAADTVTSSITLYAGWDEVSGPGTGGGASNLYIGTPDTFTESGRVDLSGITGNNIVEQSVAYVNQRTGDYTLFLGGDVSVAATQTLSADGASLFIVGKDSRRTITFTDVGYVPNISGLFTLSNGASLTLGNNLTLKGHRNAYDSLIGVEAESFFTMWEGSEITGHGDGTRFDGGGVSVSGGSFTMKGGKIHGNKAYSSGGGVAVVEGTFIMEGGEISANAAVFNGDGGGVYVTGGTFIMRTGALITGNEGNRGGGVAIFGGTTFTMEDGEISANKGVDNGVGGGVYVYLDCVFTMKDGKISDNEAKNEGGGVSVEGGTFIMKDGEISDNKGVQYGGGVNIDDGTFTMEGGEIARNRSSESGGGVHISSGGVFSKTGDSVIYGSGPQATANVTKTIPYNPYAYGHAVGMASPFRVKNNTAGSGVNLSSGSSSNWDFP